MITFKLPVPHGYHAEPVWSGEQFLIGDKCQPILEYSENFEGWSDDLTQLHEEAAGENHPIDVASRRNTIAQIADNVGYSSKIIMDIGCSSGFLLKDLAVAFPECSLIGADVVKEPLLKLSKQLRDIPLIRFDLLQCPLPTESVDVIVMLNVFEHIGDDVLAMQQTYRLLKPGGILVVEVPAGPMLFGPYDVELNHFRRYSSAELDRKLRLVGFDVVKRSHLGFLLFPMFALVKLKDKYVSRGRRKAVVRQHASATKNNFLIKSLMEIEAKLLGSFALPFGIRVLMTAKKPSVDG